MNSSNILCQPNIRSILQSIVSQFLYREDINNMCGTNTYLNELFLEDWRYVYRICLHNQPHNYDRHAVIDEKGTQSWYKEGMLHREGDQPAKILWNGAQEWYKEGVLHRDGDQPAIIYANGTQVWYKEGKTHREGDQPAIVRANGIREWWIEGKLIRKQEFPNINFSLLSRT